MPRGDGRGPAGTGKGGGIGRKVMRGRKTGPETGRGRMGGSASAGPEGYCQCANCGTKVKHNRAEPCSSLQCPQCGGIMVRV